VGLGLIGPSRSLADKGVPKQELGNEMNIYINRLNI